MTTARSDWRETRLGEISDFRNGVNYTKDNFGRGVKVINVKDFQDYTSPRYETLDEINPDGAVRPAHLLQENDVIFVRSNGNRELIGRSLALLSVPPEPVTHSAFTIRARLHERPELNPRFFAYVFRSGVIRQVLSAQGSGANISNLNQDILQRLVVPLPPREQQDRIAAILSAYDDLIEINTRRIAILEEMARRLYEEWFVHFRFPGHEAAEFDGDLPRDWSAVEFGELVDELRDSIKPEAIDPETAYVGLEHIPRRSITMREWSNASTVQSTKLRFIEDDILFGKIRPYFHKVALAPLAGVASSDAIILRAKSTELLPIAAMCASSEAFVDQATQTSNGTKMPRANWKVLAKYPLVLPPADLLAKFNGLVLPLFDDLKLMNRQNSNLRSQRDLLLPKLVSGEIDVSGAEVALEAAE